MATQAGIWMDYRKAITVILNNDKVDLAVIESNTKAPSKTSGGHHQVSPYSHQDVVAEDHRKRQFEGDLGHYFERILRRIRASSDLVLVGPGQAKKEFQNYLKEQHPQIRLKECKSVENMSNAEFTRYVCKVYNHAYS